MKTFIRLVLSSLVLVVSAQGALAGTISFPNVPMFLTYGVDPNVLFDMSIESPMAGAAYNDQPSSTCPGLAGGTFGVCYKPTQEYKGYFNSARCYRYASGKFIPGVLASATNRTCPSSGTDRWSGNFLNWATMTAIDEVRSALTGGNRIVDNRATNPVDLTTLRRANITGIADSWFPNKRVSSTDNINPALVTPFGSATIYITNANKGYQMWVGTSNGSNNLGTFNVVVDVCVAGKTEPNCKAYGARSKPEGLIQRNADRMRFALTSYLYDNDQSRGGGVLRSKAKYTGPQKNVPGTGLVVNSNAEWSEVDGYIFPNPDPTEATASSVANSGVINYINKFGAAGYKSYDPAGELFYESLRYFKNLGNTPEYSSGLTTAMKDGFPVITNWDDPIQYSCQKNFIVGINDANPWLDKKLPGTAFMSSTLANGTSLIGNDYGQPSNPDTAINVRTLTNKVGDLEGLTGTSQCIGGTTNTFTNASTSKVITGLGEVLGTCPYTPKQNSYYIAGLAHYAHTQDIRPLMQGKQTITTYMIDTQEYNATPLVGKMNMLWLAAKYGGFNDSNDDANPNVAGTGTNNTEWDANSDGEPDTYVLASDPSKLTDGLGKAFFDIWNRTSAASAVAANSTSLVTGTQVFQAVFNSGVWSGQLFAIPMTGTTLGAPAWEASDKLNSISYTGGSGRQIVTRHPVTGGIPFQWLQLHANQQASISAGDSATVGQGRVDYLRGRTTDEGIGAGKFRMRSITDTAGVVTFNKLGDIINSSPLYIGAPESGYSDPSYATFASANAGRKSVVYVGANDGMLHGFDAGTGKELIAYVPSFVISKLAKLTKQDYGSVSNPHQYYVDGSPVAADVFGSFSGCSSACWRTALVTGTGLGGQGFFALDVTNASDFSEANASKLALWEFTDQDDKDLGYTLGKPIIRKLNNGRWAAIFGNGYNNTEADGNASSSGRAFLYIVYMDGGSPWSLGTNYFKIDTGAGSPGNPNGLAGPAAIDNDGDGDVDYVYAGDLLGNMWKFDLSAASSSSWAVAFSGSPLFTATDGGATPLPQPITSSPAIIAHPLPSSGHLIIFGTGKYLESSDTTDMSVQSLYSLWDKHNGTRITSRSDLQLQTFTESGNFRFPSSTPINWRTTGSSTPDYLGWMMDLRPVAGSAVGERHTGTPQVKQGMAFFNTLIPSTTPCEFGGTGWLMALNPSSGGMLSHAPFDTNGDGLFNSSDAPSGGAKIGAAPGGTLVLAPVSGSGSPVGVGLSNTTDGTVGTILINFGTSEPASPCPGGNCTPPPDPCTSNCQPPAVGKRISWREIVE